MSLKKEKESDFFWGSRDKTSTSRGPSTVSMEGRGLRSSFRKKEEKRSTSTKPKREKGLILRVRRAPRWKGTRKRKKVRLERIAGRVRSFA